MNSFMDSVQARLAANASDDVLSSAAHSFMLASIRSKYSYNFSALGRPIIQYPQDMVAIQELIWQTRPDLIIEAGIAHGGSLILSASVLTLLDYCDAMDKGRVLDPRAAHRRVLGIDIDIRSHNRAAIEAHPLNHRIDMIEGSSIEPSTIGEVHRIASDYERKMVILDSNHTHDHVISELEAYAPLTSVGCYCVVFDTIVEDLPDSMYPDRPWSTGNNPKTAVWEYLQRLNEIEQRATDGAPLRFNIDNALESKLMITAAPDGYLKRV